MKVKRLTYSLLYLSVLGVLVACSNQSADSVSARKLEVTIPLDYISAGGQWLPDGRAMVWLNNNAAPRHVQYYVVEGDNAIYSLAVEDDPQCTLNTDYSFFDPLPDGRLGLIKRCKGRFPDRSIFEQDASYLLAYDWDTGAMEQLVAGPLPNEALSHKYTWNPEMTRGVQAFGGLFSTIYWLTPTGADAMTVTVRDGNLSFALDENFEAVSKPQTFSEKRTGMAETPDWSPDGQSIAFLATLDAIDRAGPGRALGEWGLYVMSPNELIPRKVLGDIFDPQEISWSSDSQWIALTGSTGLFRQKGLWLFSLSDEKLILAAEGHISGADWSPDGTKILSTYCLSLEICLTPANWEIWEYDVSKIVGK